MLFNSKSNLLCLLLCGLIIVSCATGSDNQKTGAEIQPEWLTQMPIDKDFFFGIGAGDDPTEARQRAIIDAGQQFSIQVVSVLQDKSVSSNSISEQTVDMLSKQTTDLTMSGVKFIDQYSDEKGMYWVLARAPVNCLLDSTESLMISYALSIKQEQKEIINLMDHIEKKVETPELRIGKSDPLFREYMYRDINYNNLRLQALLIKQIPDRKLRSASGLKNIPWDDYYYAYEDALEDQTDGNSYSDLKEVRFAFDSQYLYIKVDLNNAEPTHKRSWYQSNIWIPGERTRFYDYAIRNEEDRWITELRLHNVNPNTGSHNVETVYKDWATTDENSVIGRVKLREIELSAGDVRKLDTHTHNGEYDPDNMDGEYLYFVKEIPLDITTESVREVYYHPGAVDISRKTIAVDGNSDDWSSIQPLYESTDDKGKPDKTIKRIFAAKDEAFLYLAMELFSDKPAEDETVYSFHIQNYENWGDGDLEIGYRVWNGNWKNQWNRYHDGDRWTSITSNPSYGAAGNIIELSVPLDLLGNKESLSLSPYTNIDDIGAVDYLRGININLRSHQ